jgi:hypothetical protein
MTDADVHEASFKLTHLVWLVIGFIEVLIALRIGLKLVGANPANFFATFIYAVTDLLLWPFFGLTVAPRLGSMVLEIPSLFAMIVYALVGWAAATLIWIVLYRPREQVIVRRTRTIDEDR